MERDYKKEQSDRDEWKKKLLGDGWERRHVDQAEAGWEYVFDTWGVDDSDYDSAAMDMAAGYMVVRGNKKKGDSQDGVADNIHEGMVAAKRYKLKGTWRKVA